MLLSFPPRAGVAFTALALLGGCKGDVAGPDRTVSIIEVSPRNASMYSVGDETKFTAVLTTEAGTAGEGIEIGWIARDKTLLSVNSQGVAKALKKGGSTWVVATAGGKSDSAFVDVPATSCGTVTPTAMIIGQVVTDIPAAGFCAATVASAEYTVVALNNSLNSTGSSSIEVSGAALSTPSVAKSPALGSRASRALQLPGGTARRRIDRAAEIEFRRAERALVAPLVAQARAWYASRLPRASRSAAVPAVGEMVSINVNVTGNGCTAPRTDVSARVTAVSNAAIVLEDPRNPAGGFTNAEYASFAALFDTVIHPLDVDTFGAPTDLDANSRVIIVFTRAINERTPAGSGNFVAGLTHQRDLVPLATCPASNVGEIFYLLAPDPTGVVNGNDFDKETVSEGTPATIAHEYQHIINFSRRTYLLGGPNPAPTEETWLNEGLSHMAEELLYHRLSGRPTRANVGLDEITATENNFDSFVLYLLGNFALYHEYALAPKTTSPFRQNDDVATRGATWAFLRYAADHRAASDGTLWYDLVNNAQVGLTNLQNRLGVDAAALRVMLRDFTISVYTDDFVLGVDAKYTQPSLNARSMYPIFVAYPTLDYPLTTTVLGNNAIAPATLSTGGFALFRFKGITGADAFVKATGTAGTALPPSISLSIIRTR